MSKFDNILTTIFLQPFGDSTFIFALIFIHNNKKDRFHVKIWQKFNTNLFVVWAQL
jgi:hypothetical protein